MSARTVKLECFVFLPSLVISLLGHPGYALHNPKQQRIIGQFGNLPSGGTRLDLTSTDAADQVGGIDGEHIVGSGAGSSGSSGVLGGNIGGGPASGSSESVLGGGFAPGLGESEGNSAAGPGFPRGGHSTPTGLVGPPLGERLGGILSLSGAGVPVSRGADGIGDLAGNSPVGRGSSGSPSISASPFGADQPGGSTGTGDPLSRSSPIPADYHDVMARVRSPESGGAATGLPRGLGAAGEPHSPENEVPGSGRFSVGDPLEALPGIAPRDNPGRYGTGSLGGARPPIGRGGLGGGTGAGLGGLGGGAGVRMGDSGMRPDGLMTARNSVGLGAGAEGGVLARLRARIQSRIRAHAAARARARARAKARARARAIARAKLRARLRAAFNANLSIGGGIDASLDKAAELTGGGDLGGRAGLQGEGGTAAGIQGNSETAAYSGAGSTLYGGAAGYGGSYGDVLDGNYDFYSE